ncbi:DUF7689 domain-containing protein [Fimbriimonas ginsengisoli]|uniref:DUF7689 domain-containing protein n=1 Tax=Fimbriimonas ginsengisoli TaxID=1005039 RepID=UPI00046CF2B6|nr:hypothetical protein [Fimbriimonas ginsengisoli]
MGIDWDSPETPEQRIDRIFCGRPVQITSDEDWQYNCVAWAAGHKDKFWTHETGYGTYTYWPPGIPRGNSLAHLVAVFEWLGFVACGDETVEPEVDKIALFEQDGEWAHACKQCDDGRWWSKMDFFEDVKHTIDDVVAVYGSNPVFMKRPRA